VACEGRRAGRLWAEGEALSMNDDHSGLVVFMGLIGMPVILAGAVVLIGGVPDFSDREPLDFAKQEYDRCMERPEMWDEWARITHVYNVDKPHCRDLVESYRSTR
jgi:hypothetical protein